MVVPGKGPLEHDGIYVYHEKQQSGSRMCGQHVVNMLLQRPKYTFVDLASKAQDLDSGESMLLGINPSKFESQNYSADGYFSVGVLEVVLKENGLAIGSIKNPIFSGLLKNPSQGGAYLVQARDHWLAFRKIKNIWYELNSLSEKPMKLDMNSLRARLTGLLTEGSVFVVTPIDAETKLPLVDHWAYDIDASKRNLHPEQTIYEEPNTNATYDSGNIVDRSAITKKDIVISVTIRGSGGSIKRAINGFTADSTVNDFIEFLKANDVNNEADVVLAAPPRTRLTFKNSKLLDIKNNEIQGNISAVLSSPAVKSESFNITVK